MEGNDYWDISYTRILVLSTLQFVTAHNPESWLHHKGLFALPVSCHPGEGREPGSFQALDSRLNGDDSKSGLLSFVSRYYNFKTV